MTTVSPNLKIRLEESLQRESSVDDLYPVKDMEGYFCSLEQISDEKYTQMFDPILIEGKQIFVYLKIA